MKILIIDDELFACKSLQAIIESTHFNIESVQIVHNVEEAKEFIKSHKIDLIFLDIKLGNDSGFDILEAKIISPQTVVVISSAYDNYALKSYDYDISNYILKPFEYDDVIECLQRTNKKIEKNKPITNTLNKLYLITNQNGAILLHKKDIVCIEAKGAYSEIYSTKHPVIVVSKNLKKIEAELNYDAVLRVNRFFLINANHIITYDNKNSILTMTGDIQITLNRASILYDYFS